MIPIVAGSGSVEIAPASQQACCGAVEYTLTVANTVNQQRQFDLKVQAAEGLTVMLEPKTVIIPAKGTEELTILAKPACGLPPGNYKMIVSATAKGSCDGTCGTLCDFPMGDAEAVVTVPRGCELPEEPAEEPVEGPVEEPVDNGPVTNNTQSGGNTTSPTGAVVQTMTNYNLFAIAALFAVLAVFVVLLFLVRKTDDAKPKADNVKTDTK